jgi:NADPH:quinone reductase-like Zn-dependent oxidoreductase
VQTGKCDIDDALSKIALQGIRGKRPLEKGQKVLINGAGGGMGTFAVQIAKYY